MFSFYKRHNDKLYNSLVKLSRNIFFYKNIKLSDKFETRVVLIFFHFAIILKHYKINLRKNFPQEIYDNIFFPRVSSSLKILSNFLSKCSIDTTATF